MTQKIILVTGGSRGIGRATVIELAKQGHQVVFTYLSQVDKANEVIKEVQSFGGKVEAIKADVADESQVIQLFKHIDDIYGQITGLINNVGILKKQSRFEDLDVARWQEVLNVNVIGSFVCAREAVKRMSFRHGGNGGAIVNVSSGASRSGSPFEYVDYASSKGAMDSMTIGLAKEVADQGIRVNCVRPGLIYTDIHADGGEANRVDRLKEVLPMKRGGQPEEVAQAIIWLLSDNASFVTNNFIDMSGGL